MATNKVKRRLTAIMSADAVVAYGGDRPDDEKRLAVLKAHQDTFQSLVKRNSGEVVGRTNTALLIEYASAVNAVQCAIDVHKAVNDTNQKYPPGHQVYFRIGVHVGEVESSGSYLTGDGILLALRLGAMADVGGLLVSGSVYDNIPNLRRQFEPREPIRDPQLPIAVRTYAVPGLPRLPTHTSMAQPTALKITGDGHLTEAQAPAAAAAGKTAPAEAEAGEGTILELGGLAGGVPDGQALAADDPDRTTITFDFLVVDPEASFSKGIPGVPPAAPRAPDAPLAVEAVRAAEPPPPPPPAAVAPPPPAPEPEPEPEPEPPAEPDDTEVAGHEQAAEEHLAAGRVLAGLAALDLAIAAAAGRDDRLEGLGRRRAAAVEQAARRHDALRVEAGGRTVTVRFADGIDVGRPSAGQKNEIAFSCGYVSRTGRQTRIRQDGDGFVVEDLGSKNGTFLDETFVAEAKPQPIDPKSARALVSLGGGADPPVKGPCRLDVRQFAVPRPAVRVVISTESLDAAQLKDLQQHWPAMDTEIRQVAVLATGAVAVGGTGCAVEVEGAPDGPAAVLRLDAAGLVVVPGAAGRLTIAGTELAGPAPVEDGAEIRAGDTTFVVRLG